MPMRKSDSRWLDRLRTAKGFPSDDATDLAHFLQNPKPPRTIQLDLSPSPNPIHYPTSHEKDPQLCTIVTDVLHELFNFGDVSNRVKLKKSARKQANPRICAFHGNARSGDGDSGVEVVKRRGNRVDIEESDVNFAGFSKTDVTVIDTSYEVWKSEKWLYRKKNVWRVRDKKVTTDKSTSKLSIRKKRKVDHSKVDGGPRKGQIGLR